MAIIKGLEVMNDGYTWIGDMDLEKFFDNVNHDKLMRIISRTIKDGDVISLITKHVVSSVIIDDEYKENIIGTPQGDNLSPLLSNIMLHELDEELGARGLNFLGFGFYWNTFSHTIEPPCTERYARWCEKRLIK